MNFAFRANEIGKNPKSKILKIIYGKKLLQNNNSLVYFYISGVQIKNNNNNRSSSHTKTYVLKTQIRCKIFKS